MPSTQMFINLGTRAELDADDTVSVIVNTGNGHAFQTGLDVVQLARDRRHSRPVLARRSVPSCGSPPGIAV